VDVAIHVIRYLELGVEWEKDRRLAMSASLSQQRVWEEWMYQIDQNFVSLISANKFYTLSQAYKSLAPISGKGGGWGAAWARPLAAWILWRNWRKLRPVLEDVYGPNLQDALCLEAQRWHQRLREPLSFVHFSFSHFASLPSFPASPLFLSHQRGSFNRNNGLTS
jgi:hypothetical protein